MAVDLDAVGDFLVSGPLYVEKRWPAGGMTTDWNEVLPETVSRECEACKTQTRWRRRTQYPRYEHDVPEPHPGEFYVVEFSCNNCGKAVFRCYVRWTQSPKGIFTYLKIGQYPEFQISPPKDLEKALSSSELDLYKRGKLRHHGFGIGATPYFRRLVEDTTHEMLDLLIEALQQEPECK